MHTSPGSRSSQLAKAVEDYMATVQGGQARPICTSSPAHGARSAQLSRAVLEYEAYLARCYRGMTDHVASGVASGGRQLGQQSAQLARAVEQYSAAAMYGAEVYIQSVGSRSAQLARAVEEFTAAQLRGSSACGNTVRNLDLGVTAGVLAGSAMAMG